MASSKSPAVSPSVAEVVPVVEAMPLTSDEMDLRIADLRAQLHGIGRAAVEQLRYATQLDPGPGAARLVDDLITRFSHCTADLRELMELEGHMAEVARVAVENPIDLAGVDIAHISADQLLDHFEQIPPRYQPKVAHDLLVLARERGAQVGVVPYLEIVSTRGEDEIGITTIAWTRAGGLPTPGSVIELDGEAGMTGPVKVVGFGLVEGTVRVRLLTETETQVAGPAGPSGVGMHTSYQGA